MNLVHLRIENNSQEIAYTNYWDTLFGQLGEFFLTGNAGAWRLLVPDNRLYLLPEIADAQYLTIDRLADDEGPFVQLMFETLAKRPVALQIHPNMVGCPLRRSRQQFPLLVYTREGLKQTHEIRRIC